MVLQAAPRAVTQPLLSAFIPRFLVPRVMRFGTPGRAAQPNSDNQPNST